MNKPVIQRYETNPGVWCWVVRTMRGRGIAHMTQSFEDACKYAKFFWEGCERHKADAL